MLNFILLLMALGIAITILFVDEVETQNSLLHIEVVLLWLSILTQDKDND